ncbi:MAG: hypothetical protein FRX48_08338 [Lasallia pustulata]|uniref:Uncharacterized protein n=1 Tax=Lasallia pustulata TaxID=136370 RepID=A0A5M8PFA1_9LECA|nr:MAG: hypothetical protein FRX48_08338 [Lasallia pustulata]
MWKYLTKAANSIKGLFTHRPPAPSPNVMSTADPPPPDLAPDPLIILDATTAPISTHNLQTRTLNLLIHRRLSRHLPNELVLAILDHAHTYLMLPPISLPRQTPPLRISEDRHSIPPFSGDKIILATPPLTQATIRRIRKITITWLSKDQGWSSYPEQQGTYDGSWTYFDVALQPAISAPPPNTTTDPDLRPHKYHRN